LRKSKATGKLAMQECIKQVSFSYSILFMTGRYDLIMVIKTIKKTKENKLCLLNILNAFSNRLLPTDILYTPIFKTTLKTVIFKSKNIL
jgi:hypothetical protein